MLKKFYAWYGSLPGPVKIAIATAEAAAATALWNWYSTGGFCFTKPCLKTLVGAIVTSVAIALHNLYKPTK